MKGFIMKKNALSLALLLSAPLALADAPISTAKAPSMTTLSGDLNIGFVDSFSAMRESDSGKKASQQLQATQERLANELRNAQEKLMKEANDFQTKQATMSETAREAEQKRLAKAERDLKARGEEAEMEMKLAMQKVTDSLSKEVEVAITKVAKDKKLDAVVDTSTGRVLYVENKANYTSSLVKEMDNEHKIQLASNKKAPAESVKLAQSAKKDDKKVTA
jgi:Skp family chaperone for outer membrane proteins